MRLLNVLWVLILCAPSLISAPAVILRPVENLYSGPSGKKDVVTQAILGTNVEVLKKSFKMAAEFVRRMGMRVGFRKHAVAKSRQAYASRGRVAEVTSLYAHLYPEASVTRRAPLMTAAFETRLEVIGGSECQDERWLQVRLPDARKAWVQSGDVTFEPNPLSIDEMLALAQRFLGLPYTWGGTSSFGYDCSGFTQMLCRRRGISLPRDAQPQADWSGSSAVIDRARAGPGDLLYFGTSDRR